MRLFTLTGFLFLLTSRFAFGQDDHAALAQAAFKAKEYAKAIDEARTADKAAHDPAIVEFQVDVWLAWADDLASDDHLKEARQKLQDAAFFTKRPAVKADIAQKIQELHAKLAAAYAAKDYDLAFAIAEAELAATPSDEEVRKVHVAILKSRQDSFALALSYHDAARYLSESHTPDDFARLKDQYLSLRDIEFFNTWNAVQHQAKTGTWDNARLAGYTAKLEMINLSRHADVNAMMLFDEAYFDYLQQKFPKAERAMDKAVALATDDTKADFEQRKKELTEAIAGAKNAPDFRQYVATH